MCAARAKTMDDINGPSNSGSRRRNRATPKASEVADWAHSDPALLQDVIAAVAYRGGALRLGYTRDGGAYAIGIYGDGDPFTEYVPPHEDINEYLKGVLRDYQDE